MSNEALITINGIKLSTAQSLTVRVAVSSFVDDLVNNGLGDDTHGKQMTEAYLNNLNSIIRLIHAPPNNNCVNGGRCREIGNGGVYCKECEGKWG